MKFSVFRSSPSRIAAGQLPERASGTVHVYWLKDSLYFEKAFSEGGQSWGTRLIYPRQEIAYATSSLWREEKRPPTYSHFSVRKSECSFLNEPESILFRNLEAIDSSGTVAGLPCRLYRSWELRGRSERKTYIYYWVWQPPFELDYPQKREYVRPYMLPGVEGLVLESISIIDGGDVPYLQTTVVEVEWLSWDDSLLKEAFGPWLNNWDLAVPVNCAEQARYYQRGG